MISLSLLLPWNLISLTFTYRMKIFLQWLTERHKKALFEALEKIKAGNFLCSQLVIILP